MTGPESIRFLIDQATRFIAPETIAAEWLITLFAVLVIAVAPFGGAKFIQRAASGFRNLAQRRRTSIVVCGILPIALRLAMLGIAAVPDPSIHDEFSHLLLGDTLAHGRLTNPTHPMWRHFESIHIIQRPTYNSMYPPGQGAFLALGESVFDEPWAGVVISVGLMFAAICWMMQGWLRPEWALFGTLLAILKFGLAGFWIDSYMGGSVGAIGGALLIGSLPRLKRDDAGAWLALLFGAGVVVLMNTRPFEGAVLTCLATLYLLPSLWTRFRSRGWRTLAPLVLPAAAVLVCGIAFTGYYSWRVTGNPMRMPYQVNRDTYGWPENLAFLAPKKVMIDDKVLDSMYRKEIEHHERYSSWDRILDSLGVRLFDVWTFFIGPLLTFPILLLPWYYRNPQTRPLFLFLAGIAALNLTQMVLYPYHLSEAVPILFTLLAAGTQHVYANLARTSRKRATCFALVLPFCVITVQAMKNPASQLNLPLAYWERGYEGHRDARAAIIDWLEQHSGKQLVIVRYADNHSPDQEWVYNGADIDGSKVVWAREKEPQSNRRLLEYFHDRKAWLLEADVYPQRVVPYRNSDDDCPLTTVDTRDQSTKVRGAAE